MYFCLYYNKKKFSANARLKLLFSAKKKFNFDAKKGLQFMFDHGFLAKNPESVANFLYESNGLKKVYYINLLIINVYHIFYFF